MVSQTPKIEKIFASLAHARLQLAMSAGGGKSVHCLAIPWRE